MVTTAQQDLADLRKSEQWINNEKRQLLKLMLDALSGNPSPLKGLVDMLGLVEVTTDKSISDINQEVIANIYAIANSLLTEQIKDLERTINCWNYVDSEAKTLSEIDACLRDGFYWKVVSVKGNNLMETGHTRTRFFDLFEKLDPSLMYFLYQLPYHNAPKWVQLKCFCPSRMKGGESVTA